MAEPVPVAKVIKILSEFEIVINKGLADGIKPDDVFLIYSLGEILTDPDSGENLGRLELVKGRARVKHLQDRAAILESNRFEKSGGQRRKIIKSSSGMLSSFGFPSTEEVIENERSVAIPFSEPALYDLAKKI